MKIISLYLALFLGTILVTTDAAPRGSDKALGKPSLRHLNDYDAEGHAEFAELTCNILETFDNLGRDENNIRQKDGLVWSPLCDDFNPLDPLLCPFPDNVAGICSEKKPYENPAAKEWWCMPLYGVIEDVDRRNDCIKYCTNYVSEARGGCCNIDCGEEIFSILNCPSVGVAGRACLQSHRAFCTAIPSHFSGRWQAFISNEHIHIGLQDVLGNGSNQGRFNRVKL
jgi:hypothetical protein